MKFVAGDGKKKRNFWDPHPSGPPPCSLRAPFLWVRRPHPSQAPRFFLGLGPHVAGPKNEHTEETLFVLSPCFFFSRFFFFVSDFFLSRLSFFVLSRMSFVFVPLRFLCPGTRTSTFLCLCQIASADVPVRSTLMATIAQLAVGLECWVGGGSDSRVRLRAGGARVVQHGSGRSGGCRCLTFGRWSQVDCLLCEAMRTRDEERPHEVVWP